MSWTAIFGLIALFNALMCASYVAGLVKGKNDAWNIVTDWREYYQSKVDDVQQQQQQDKQKQIERYGHDCSLHQ